MIERDSFENKPVTSTGIKNKFEAVVVVAKPLVFVWGKSIRFHSPWRGHDIVMNQAGIHHKHLCFKASSKKCSAQGGSAVVFGFHLVLFVMDVIRFHQKLDWLSGGSVCDSNVARNY